MAGAEAGGGGGALAGAQPREGQSGQQQQAHPGSEQRQPVAQPITEQGAGQQRGRPHEQQGASHAALSPREAQGAQHEGAHALAEVGSRVSPATLDKVGERACQYAAPHREQLARALERLDAAKMVLLGVPRGSADAQAESAAGTASDELAVAASASHVGLVQV